MAFKGASSDSKIDEVRLNHLSINREQPGLFIIFLLSLLSNSFYRETNIAGNKIAL